jgi:Lar family restriction alleviation protein
MTTENLLPCPFCGTQPEWINEALSDSHYYIKCPHCQFVMKQDRRDKVIGFWNNRPQSSHKHVVGGPASASALEGEQLPAEGRGEANTCAGFWCQNEMYGKPRCSEVCTWCHGYRRG